MHETNERLVGAEALGLGNARLLVHGEDRDEVLGLINGVLGAAEESEDESSLK
jgi:hypothetical protein